LVVAFDEKQKLQTELEEELDGVKRSMGEEFKKCIIDVESLRGIHAAVKMEKALDTTQKNVLWQEIVAALNRRKCVSSELADELIKGEWRI